MEEVRQWRVAGCEEERPGRSWEGRDPACHARGDVDPRTGLLAKAGPATPQTVFSESLQLPVPWFLICIVGVANLALLPCQS